MGGVFINYRGEDSQTCAALLDRELSERFGKDRVFLDSRSIPVGEDFVEVMLGRLRTCSVLLVVIGPHWLTLTDQAGRRRIDSPADWIHREIVEALARGVRVIPVLTDGVPLPAEAELPADIAGLGRRQYVHVRRRYIDYDLAQLVDKIIQTDPQLAEVAWQHQLGPAPRQLSGAPRLFTGRARELAHRALGRWASRFDRRYREFVLGSLRFIDLKGLATVGYYTPELDEVFIDVSLAFRAPNQVSGGLLAELPAEVTDRHSLGDFLDHLQPVVLAVVGVPGSGKTTLLRHTARNARLTSTKTSSSSGVK